jgi:hypothetical protein
VSIHICHGLDKIFNVTPTEFLISLQTLIQNVSERANLSVKDERIYSVVPKDPSINSSVLQC